MTIKDYDWGFGRGLENMAISGALNAESPNPRSPAYALQALARTFQNRTQQNENYYFFKNMYEFSDDDFRGVVGWNEQHSCWQVGGGTHVPVRQIAQVAVRWYAHGWDLSRHTRDSEVIYPEDLGLLEDEHESKHLSAALMPLKDEITRRFFTARASARIGYLDVYRCEDEQFTAAIGWFDDYRTHRILEPVSNFWQLEVRKVMPLLSELHVTSYRLQCIYAKEMGLLR